MAKNILFLAHSAQVGGAELCLLDLLERLPDINGLVVIPWDGPLKERVEAAGWEVVIHPMPWWISFRGRSWSHLRAIVGGMPRRLRLLDGILTSRSIDLVYTNSIACIDGAIAARFRGIPHVWHIHEAVGTNRELAFYLPTALVPRLVRALSRVVIVPSRAAGAVLRKGDRSDKVRIVPNGVDLARFGGDSASGFRAELGIPHGAKVVTVIGAINENKRQTDFVEAAGIVAGSSREVYFVVVGHGSDEYVERIKEGSRRLGLGDRFIVAGVVSDPTDVLAASDIVVSTSLVESFGRTLVEAMAASRPVVSTRNGGAEEIVADGETGLLVPAGQPEEMAAAIATLLASEERAREMGRRGRTRAEKLFSVERYVEDIRQLTCAIP